MTYQHKPGQGSALRNSRREKDAHPNFRGDVMTPDGVLYEIAVWEGKTQSGSDRLSFRLSVPRPKPDADARTSPAARPDDDDMPF